MNIIVNPCVSNDRLKIKLFLEFLDKIVLDSIVGPMVLIANRRSTNTISIGPMFLIANIRSTNTISKYDSGHKPEFCSKPHHIERLRFVS